MKLTKLQLEVLQLMQQPGSVVHYMRYMGRFNRYPYYYESLSHKRCTKQIEGLLERGLAEKFERNHFGDHKVRLTEAGRNYK